MTASTPSGTDIRTGTGYAFDNDDPYAVDRHRLLAALLDPLTTGRLTAVGDLAGRSCLDVGAGGGSIAAWLAQRAGPTGRVVATDLNPRHLAADAGYTILQHDLVREPVPAGPWDLITARLILTHLPQRRDILHRLAAELVPGGWLLVEEYDPSAPGLLLHADDPYAVDLLATYQQVFVEQIRPAAGTDPTWCRQVHTTMINAGLVDVDTTVHAAPHVVAARPRCWSPPTSTTWPTGSSPRA